MITQTLLDEAAVLLSACRKRRVKLAIAESCAGVPELIAVVGRSAVAQHARMLILPFLSLASLDLSAGPRENNRSGSSRLAQCGREAVSETSYISLHAACVAKACALIRSRLRCARSEPTPTISGRDTQESGLGRRARRGGRSTPQPVDGPHSARPQGDGGDTAWCRPETPLGRLIPIAGDRDRR